MRCFAILVAALIASPADAAGLYNLPTSMAQCLGVGFGPGYHAPLLLGPAIRAPGASQRIRRVPEPFTPQPNAGCFGESSCLACGEAGPAYGRAAAYAPASMYGGVIEGAPAGGATGPVVATPAGASPGALLYPAPAGETIFAPAR